MFGCYWYTLSSTRANLSESMCQHFKVWCFGSWTKWYVRRTKEFTKGRFITSHEPIYTVITIKRFLNRLTWKFEWRRLGTWWSSDVFDVRAFQSKGSYSLKQLADAIQAANEGSKCRSFLGNSDFRLRWILGGGCKVTGPPDRHERYKIRRQSLWEDALSVSDLAEKIKQSIHLNVCSGISGLVVTDHPSRIRKSCKPKTSLFNTC